MKEQNGEIGGIQWMYINSRHYWQVYLYEAKVGDNAIDIASSSNIQFNSRAAVNYIPLNSYKQIFEILLKDRECSTTNTGLWECECSGPEHPDEQFPPLRINMGSSDHRYWFELKGSQYIEKV